MRKLKCDCRWNKLTRPQRETMENWLFQDHLGYTETLSRVEKQFGVKGSRASLCHYYQRRLHERQAMELVETQAMADTVGAPEANAEAMRVAAMKLIAKTTLRIAFERPDRLKELESLTKLLLMNEDIEIRRSRVKLEQDRFRYETASAASEDLPKLARLLMQIDEDESLTKKEKLAKVHDLLFPDKARLDIHEFEKNEEGEEDGEDGEEYDDSDVDDADGEDDTGDPPEEEPAKSDAAKARPVKAGRPAKEDLAATELKPQEPVSDPPSPPAVPAAAAPSAVEAVTSAPPEESPDEKELKQLIMRAEAGNITSACALGSRYRDGFGVPKDLTKAREWLGKAAAGGDANAKIAHHALCVRYGNDC